MVDSTRVVERNFGGYDEVRPGAARRAGHTRRQRAFDLVMILLLSPVLLLVGAVTAAIVFVDSPGSVFYRCERIGLHGRRFRMLKFRKLHQHASGPGLTTRSDSRFTPIGRFLSASRLDELPQLWNVVKGDMRLVGPRPEAPEFVAQFSVQYEEILTVLPGLTGPAQVRHAEEGSLLDEVEDPVEIYRQAILPTKVEIDLEYARSHSLARDLMILAHTLALPVTVAYTRARGWLGGSAHLRAASSIAFASALLVLTLAFVAQAGAVR